MALLSVVNKDVDLNCYVCNIEWHSINDSQAEDTIHVQLYVFSRCIKELLLHRMKRITMRYGYILRENFNEYHAPLSDFIRSNSIWIKTMYDY